ncbi:uncharacterized protein LOC125868669 [Solanum stenotomum]|uniref:uncharacterized protein LOC125868669 n=1 Tax=Solanum stenotomum TaxID=172797 RepID=UPI0020D02EAE|nr:uncharacterized protein LOC125868669 [Solanum stenotomum]
MVIKERRTAMLINDMDILISWFTLNKLKKRNLSKRLERQRGLKPVMVISHIHGPMDMVIPSYDKGFSVKVPPICDLSSTKKGKHEGKCLVGSNACFGCGKMDHKIRDFPSIAKNDGDNHQRAQPNPSSGPSGSGPNAPKQNKFHTLHICHDQEGSPDLVTGMLKVFQLDVYAFLTPVLPCLL